DTTIERVIPIPFDPSTIVRPVRDPDHYGHFDPTSLSSSPNLSPPILPSSKSMSPPHPTTPVSVRKKASTPFKGSCIRCWKKGHTEINCLKFECRSCFRHAPGHEWNDCPEHPSTSNRPPTPNPTVAVGKYTCNYPCGRPAPSSNYIADS